MQEILVWLQDRHKWILESGRRLLTQESLTDKDYCELTELCKKEAEGPLKGNKYSFPKGAFAQSTSKNLRLCSIGDIQGINLLSPRKPLNFGVSNLTLVFGQNGSGKSGYVRILKHSCGARNPGQLHHNFFSAPVTQSCSISYEIDGDPQSHTWDVATGVVENLKTVDIFDASCGQMYVTDENEVTYEPQILSFFSDLINICEEVSRRLAAEIEALCTKKPLLPQEFVATKLGQWYEKISHETRPVELDKKLAWSDTNDIELKELQKRLAEPDPTEKAKQLHKQNGHLTSLIKETGNFLKLLSDKNCQTILDMKKSAFTKKEAAKVVAEQVFSNSPLSGVGSEAWKLLWSHARRYSKEQAYKEVKFPFIEDDARCVLCQQPLSEKAKKRFQGFEEYIKGETQHQVELAEKEHIEAFEKISDIPTIDNLNIKIDAIDITEKKQIDDLKNLYIALRNRKEQLATVNSMDKLPSLPHHAEWLEQATKQSAAKEVLAKGYEEDAKSDNRDELKEKLLGMQTKKWLSQQKAGIAQEVGRLKIINKLKNAKKLTNTAILSRKKGELAKDLITKAYIERFNSELKELGASKIKVELKKTRTPKGKALHQLKLKGAYHGNPTDILSEGEYRIISIAAFLADVKSKQSISPFVFDDPISSLDQNFEEAVVQRLVDISRDRQLIIFTHRLSLLGLVQDFGKKAGIKPDIICIRSESWGTGEPGDVPVWAEKPQKANNILLDQRLRDARKVFNEKGWQHYEIDAQSLCSEFRKLIEKTIEYDLMADVVQRHRREIQTKNKIEKLSKIKKQDCDFLDELMTKYSRYEHSQSSEAPVTLPDPDELDQDLTALKEWRLNFSNRKVSE